MLDKEWLVALTTQLKKTRAVSVGGVFKDYISQKEPEDLAAFELKIDNAMRKQNVYYDDLIVGKVLRTLVITKVSKNGFQEYMKSIGKFGGQNKLPRLSNDRTIAAFFNN
jgi:hypothetical protein